MQLIGLTGGVASGKSTCGEYLRANGIPVIDADELSRQVLTPGSTAYKKVCRMFPATMRNGVLNRTLLGDLIFNDPKAKSKLEKIVHPAVIWGMIKLVVLYWLLGSDRIALEIPLLYEAKLDRFMSYTVCIYATKDLRERRLMMRNDLSVEQAHSRVVAQLSLESKCDRADIVIDNQGDVRETLRQIKEKVVTRRPSRLVHRVLLHAVPLAVAFGLIMLSAASLFL